jgi:UDP-glucose 4-epimerase
MKQYILVTGGAGYIGSHTIRKLIDKKYNIIVIDNFSQGHIDAILSPNVNIIKSNINNKQILDYIFSSFSISTVIHFASSAIVNKSIINPALYYDNNVISSLVLLDKMIQYKCKKIIFSSSCATYGNSIYIPIDENHLQIPINPYGNTKLTVEKILLDYEKAYGLKSAILRYFNVGGASKDGLIGEDHNPETHLIPLVLKTVIGKLNYINIFGANYPTPDGTCIRDYIHVDDIVDAHIKSMNYLNDNGNSIQINLGSGTGVSVNEIIKIAEKITKKSIRRNIESQRQGDPESLIASNILAKTILNWEPLHSDINNIIKTAWNWMSGIHKGKFDK